MRAFKPPAVARLKPWEEIHGGTTAQRGKPWEAVARHGRQVPGARGRNFGHVASRAGMSYDQNQHRTRQRKTPHAPKWGQVGFTLMSYPAQGSWPGHLAQGHMAHGQMAHGHIAMAHGSWPGPLATWLMARAHGHGSSKWLMAMAQQACSPSVSCCVLRVSSRLTRRTR